MEKTWRKINLSEEQIAGDVLITLQDKFNVVYKLNKEPKDFACFFKAKHSQSSAVIYLSPRAAVECEFIINNFSAMECDPPDYTSMGFLSGNKDFAL